MYAHAQNTCNMYKSVAQYLRICPIIMSGKKEVFYWAYLLFIYLIDPALNNQQSNLECFFKLGNLSHVRM